MLPPVPPPLPPVALAPPVPLEPPVPFEPPLPLPPVSSSPPEPPALLLFLAAELQAIAARARARVIVRGRHIEERLMVGLGMGRILQGVGRWGLQV
jgi:hypothetical protein